MALPCRLAQSVEGRAVGVSVAPVPSEAGWYLTPASPREVVGAVVVDVPLTS